ncbi:rifin [Plasmodium falciparum RAJ116]|uniref:Rifin n=1 Tax=Plasmodium falciparum RAJ116 TaxID=580058 RepID=A0A0L0D2V1_PLAFA|nr:rifin [Plasmodium falciparum RAJ116]
MKEIMHDFDRQTSQRFEEYNERMNKNRQKYKLEKEMKQVLHTLEKIIGVFGNTANVRAKKVAE